MSRGGFARRDIPAFRRTQVEPAYSMTRIGAGALGGKAQGLATVADALESAFREERYGDFDVVVPRLTVLTADVFEAFMARNDLYDAAFSDRPDDRIAHAFQQAALPTEIVGDLKALSDQVHTPLAIRSSSLLEDALFRPFAGVYQTKMIPNNQPDSAVRFQKLVEAIKFVYASTYFKRAKDYIRATDKTSHDEKMGVVIQEVLGNRHGERYYPDVSGVCRSYNFYPTVRCRPEEGVVNLALGLGKTIVDGAITWCYSPARPKLPPPFASTHELLQNTQTEFWAVNIGRIPKFDPIAESEYLVKCDLATADYDGVLSAVASTYDAGADRMVAGTGLRGPRALTFAPLLELEQYRLNDVLGVLLSLCERTIGAEVEIEFAMTVPARGGRARPCLGLLQVRPMVVSDELVEIRDEEEARSNVLVTSDRAMGNGMIDTIRDVVYVKPGAFEAKYTRVIAEHLERLNARLMSEKRPYLLIGFGRWGSCDPWLGIPVDWGQICGAKVIVEATVPSMTVEASQGSHFFHNLSSFEVCYLCVSHNTKPAIDWEWLNAQTVADETAFVRHARLEQPIVVKVDGREGRGAIWRPE